MSNSGSSTKTISILVAVLLVTVALLGAEMWNRNHRNAPVAPATVTAPAPEAPATPDAPLKSNRHGAKRPAPLPKANDGRLING